MFLTSKKGLKPGKKGSCFEIGHPNLPKAPLRRKSGPNRAQSEFGERHNQRVQVFVFKDNEAGIEIPFFFKAEL